MEFNGLLFQINYGAEQDPDFSNTFMSSTELSEDFKIIRRKTPRTGLTAL